MPARHVVQSPRPAAGASTSDRTPARGTAGTPRHHSGHRSHRILQSVAVAVAVCIMAAAGAGAAVVRRFDSNITSADVSAQLGDDRPEALDTDPSDGLPLNILLMGVDKDTGSQRSDTTILAHLSADRSRAELISIPRDSWVQIPACTLADGTVTEPQEFKFNEAFSIGGAACTIRTVEQLTGVRIDDYAMVDFAGFTEMVDAVGGVPFCVPEDIDDKQAKVQLEAGCQTLDGTQALGFVRARKSLGDGSDLGRIDRQQQFLEAMVAKVTSAGTLTDVTALYGLIDSATRSMTTGPSLASVTHLVSLARSMSGVPAEAIDFRTVPTADRGDGANVVWAEPESAAIWQALATDVPLPAEAPDS